MILQCIRFLFGYITPFLNTGGEPVQIYLMWKKHGVKVSTSSTALIIERILRQTLAMVFIIIGIVYLLVIYEMSLSVRIGLIIFVVVFSWLLWTYYKKSIDGQGFFNYMIRLLHLTKWSFVTRKENRCVIDNIDKNTATFMTAHPGALMQAMGVAVVTTTVMIMQVWLIISFMGFEVDMKTLILVYALTNVVAFIPIPGSLGTYEGGSALLFAGISFGANAGVAFSLIMRAASIVACIPGLILLPYYGLKVQDVITKKESEMEEEIDPCKKKEYI